MRAKYKQPAAAGLNTIWRNEPTWGDVAVLGRVIAITAPANQAQLASVFGGVTRGPAHLQKVRNASAHLNDQTLADVLALRVYYLAGPIRFPCEAVFWLDVNDGDFAFIDWVSEMRHVAVSAIG
jgi:hypothetical protein